MPDHIHSNPFNRPPRLQDVFKPVDLDIPAPPNKPEDQARNMLMALLPVASFLVMGVVYSFSSIGSGGSGILYAVPMIAMGLFSVLIGLVMFAEQKHEAKQKWIKQVRDYHRQLDKKESRLQAGRELQMDYFHARCPSPDEIEQRVRGMFLNLWERRLEDPDFLALRLGIGDIPSRIGIKPPDPDLPGVEIRRAFGLYTHYRQISDAPVVINFAELSSIAIVGHRNRTLPFVYYLLAQIEALHSPQDVQLFLFSSNQYYRSWQWLRWLPHVSADQVGGQPTNLAFSSEANRAMITAISKSLDSRRTQVVSTGEENAAKIGGPYYIVLFDDEMSIRDEPAYNMLITSGKDRRAISIILCNTLEDVPGECHALVEISDQNEFSFGRVGPEGIKQKGVPETFSLVQADNLAHRLIPVTLRTLAQTSRIPTQVNLLQVYSVERIRDLRIESAWMRLPAEKGRLPFKIQIGSESLVAPLYLDLSENRDGPHGIIAGTTGSGKSELLQTLVSSLAIEHHPYFVNFLLIDFKGGSTFGVFADMPHTVGLVSNLDKTSALRALEAIKAENLRRQTFLKKLGIEDVADYHQKLLRLGFIPPEWEPLPHLFIIVDEFAQMAVDMPTFLPELVATVRVGRSLGLHLILATQRPAGVVSDEMRANLNFRISLRVQTIDDSRDMLRRPDAALLPPDLPGRAYFQLGDGGTPRQFQTARVGVDYEEVAQEVQSEAFVYQLDFEQRYPILASEKKKDKSEKPSIAQKLVQEMQQIFEQLRDRDSLKTPETILLPPLKPIIYLNEILKQNSGWNPENKNWDSTLVNAGLRAPVGLMDDLATRTQPVLWVDFQRATMGGNLTILGAPGSGKTIFLRSLIYSLAHRYSPRDVHIYVISFAGRSLEALKQDIPHLGDVIIGTETERLHRLLRLLEKKLEERKVLFGNKQALDLASYNEKAPEGQKMPAICVMVDNFGEFRNVNLTDELDEMGKLIQDGRAYGIYFVLTGFQTNDIPYKISNLIEQRLALNLTDRDEYVLYVGRPGSLEFDPLSAGRGFNNGNPPLHIQLAFPFDPPIEKVASKEKNITDLTPSTQDMTDVGDKKQADPDQQATVEEIPVQAPLTFADTFKMMRETCATLEMAGPAEIVVLKTRYNLSTFLEKHSLSQKNEKGVPLDTIIGENGDTLTPLRLNWVEDGPHFLVAGPSHSGRTSLLQAFALSAAARFSPQQMQMVLVDGTHGSLRRLAALPHVLDWVTDEIGLSRSIANLFSELASRRKWVQENVPTTNYDENPSIPFPRILFIMDDYDLTRDAMGLNEEILAKLGKHIRQDSDLGFHFILSSITQNVSHNSDPLILQMKLSRVGISLCNAELLDILGGRVSPAMRNEELPEGRGYLISRSGARLVQFAYPDPDTYDAVFGHWKGWKRRAEWANPATPEEIGAVEVESAPVHNRSGNSGGASEASQPGSYIDIDAATQRYILLRKQEEEKKQKGKPK